MSVQEESREEREKKLEIADLGNTFSFFSSPQQRTSFHYSLTSTHLYNPSIDIH